MIILSKACKPDKSESHNSLKFSFTNIQGLRSNFVDCESFLESNSWHSCFLWDKPGWLNWFCQFLCERLSSFNSKWFWYSYAWSRSYNVYYTVKPSNKITISNVRIIKVFIIGKWNFLQGPFIHIRRVIFQSAKSYFLVSVVFCSKHFPSAIYQRVIWYHSINYTRLRLIFLSIC